VVHFCLIAGDFDAVVAKLAGGGIRFVMPPHPTDARKPGEMGPAP
jgi:hypothetical protein